MSEIKILGKVDLEQVDPKHIKIRKEREAKEARAKAAEEKLAQINARLNSETKATTPREPWKKLQFQQDYLSKRVFGEYPKEKLPESIQKLSHSQKIKDGIHPAPLHKRRELAEKLPSGIKKNAKYNGEVLMQIK